MYVTRDGRCVLGGAGGGVSVDARVLAAAPAGLAREFTDDEVVCQSPASTLNAINLVSGAARQVDGAGANFLVAANGRWAATLGGETRASGGYRRTDAVVLDLTADGILWTRPYQGTTEPILGVSLVTGEVVAELPYAPVKLRSTAAAFSALDGHRAVWIEAGRLRTYGLPGAAVPSWPLFDVRAVDVDGHVYLLEWCNDRLTLRPYDSLDGWVLAPAPTFEPCLRCGDGILLAGWSVGEGEHLGEGRCVAIDVASPRVPLGPTAPTPMPPPTTSRVRPARACFGRKKLVAWYHGFNERADYPSADPNAYPGNAAMATTAAEIAKAGPLPLIQTPEIGLTESELGRTLAYYAHGKATVEAGRAIYEQALRAPEKPVIWYLLDATGYRADLLPLELPSWVDRRRTWISVQLYRDPGESIEACRNRWHAILAKASGWGLPLCPTVQWYDRNGQMPITDVRATMDITEDALRAYDDQTIGWLPFGWGRPGGVVTHPELLEDAWAFFFAVPGRPNRFDAWLSANWQHDLFASKVRYSTPMFRSEEIATLEEAGRAIHAIE